MLVDETLVEFSSLLAMEVRMGGLDEEIALMTDQRFLHLIGESFNVLPVSIEDFTLARGFVQTCKSGLRAGDALHLTIASNHGARSIYSLDKKLVAAGNTLGLPASH